jgi:hypothetical protein
MKLNAWEYAGVVLSGVLYLQLISAAASETKYTTKEMLSDCESIVSAVKSTDDPDQVELENTFSTGHCWGAFSSLQQVIALRDVGAKYPLLQICASEETTLVQLIKQFDSYARRHPERMQEPFITVAVAALGSAYPCR